MKPQNTFHEFDIKFLLIYEVITISKEISIVGKITNAKLIIKWKQFWNIRSVNFSHGQFSWHLAKEIVNALDWELYLTVNRFFLAFLLRCMLLEE